jgi:hypothetical protein
MPRPEKPKSISSSQRAVSPEAARFLPPIILLASPAVIQNSESRAVPRFNSSLMSYYAPHHIGISRNADTYILP